MNILSSTKQRILAFALFFSASLAGFSQGTNSCVINNAGFELGNTTGWTCKSGYYGATPCTGGACPRYATVYTGACITSGVLNANLTNIGDRHTMMSTAGGNDVNATTPAVPVVPPGGGTYSFRLGNGNTGGANGTYSQAEAIRLTFGVTNQNASFTYRYAFFVANPGHAFMEQPSFEVVVLDASENVIPCGRYFVVAGNYPSCVNAAGFVNGNNGYVYKGWTDVGLDLTGYIGQNISVEFRTTDCYPGSSGSSSSCMNNCCTVTSGGGTCTYCSPATSCTPAGGACPGGSAGTHSAYAYIDAYCAPLTVKSPVFCAGASSIQICAPAGYVSYAWPAGQPGLSGSPATQCVTINNPVSGTTYTVNMTSATGCPTSTTVTLIGATPTVNSATVCAGQPTTLTASGGSGTYSWSPGGATTTSIVVSPNVTTTYTVTAQPTGTVSCPASATGTVTVGNMAATVTPPVTVCPGGSATVSATWAGTGTPTYSWSNGSSSSAITVTPGSTTTYSVSITNGLCTATGSTTVTVAPLPTPTASSSTICLGNSATLTATGGGTYSWSDGSTSPSIVVSPSGATTYTVLVTNSAGCTATATGNVTVNSVTPGVSSATVCPGVAASLTATGGGTYSWSTGSTSPTISVTPSTTTNYSVTVTNGGCSSTVQTTVTVNAIIPAPITPPATICPGASMTLTTSGGGTYSWSTGETTASIVVTPGGPTTYSVVVTGQCQATASTSVTVAPVVASVSPPTTICLGQSTSFTASGGTTYTWSDGSTNPTITLTPTASGTYSVIVANSTGCTDVASTNVTVNSVSPTISPAVTICAADIATLTAGGGGTYSWSNGSTSPSISVSPSGTTTYSVTVTNGGCSSTLSQTVTVMPFVVASVTTATVCSGNNVTLTASGGNQYSWSTGATSPTIVITNPPVGNASYSVIVSSGTSCIDTGYTTITVNPLPTPTISAPVTVCAGTGVQFTAGGGSTYSWSNGMTGATINLNPTANGTYTVLVTDANGCTGTASTNVTVVPIPTPTASSATICAGASATLNATGGGTYLWNTGQAGPSLVASPASTTTYVVTVSSANGCSASTSGVITVVPAPTAVFSNTAPCEGNTVTFTDGSLPVQGDPIQSWSWVLNGGTPSSSTTQHPTSFYPTAGAYTATLVITSKTGCKDTVAQTVVIYANPVALFNANDSACASLCHTFNDSSQAVNGNITSWYWTFPGGNPSSSTAQNPTICYSAPGAYGASLTVTTNYGCKDVLSLTPVINVYPVPNADFCVMPEKASITDPSFKFCDLWTSDVTQWFWTFGDGDSDFVSTDPTHSYTAAITSNDFYTFNVCLNVRTAHGCWDTICKTVELIPEFTFYIPNTFTPNEDGANEFFFGKGRGIKEYDIWIFDRWGNQIWNCHYEGSNTSWDTPLMDGMSAACKWDGKVVPGGADMNGRSGDYAQEDVYVWKVKLLDVFNKKHSYVGHVNIVK